MKLRGGKGQVSLEFMLVVGFMFVMLTPILILYANTQNDTTDAIVQASLLRAGNTMRDVAERVYFAGEPAQETVTITMPKNVRNASIDGKDQVYRVTSGTGSYDMRVRGVAPLNGTLPRTEGTYNVVIRAEGGQVWIEP